MLFYLFLLFTLVPLVELAILIWIGGQTAWWVPILMVIGTGIAGAALARWQGWQVLERIREDARAGLMPADALIDGFLILAAGILLVTPGVLSDLVGVALLIPPLRALVKRGITWWIKRSVEVRITRAGADFRQKSDGGPASRRDEIIDAKVFGTRVEDAE
ncbi:MAG: FxsA family protein [Phycisphaerales bacterium]|nr:FxsA family protein [Phycisphaerales bacterium]